MLNLFRSCWSFERKIHLVLDIEYESYVLDKVLFSHPKFVAGLREVIIYSSPDDKKKNR